MNIPKVSYLSEAQASQRTPQKELGKDAFLKILVAQLQNQDPLSGGDNTEYIAQLAQFSSLEQMQTINTNLEVGFSMLLYYQNVQYASQLIGKTVTIQDGDEELQGVAEKVQMVNGDIQIIVDGKAYWLEQITEVEDGSLPPGEPTTE